MRRKLDLEPAVLDGRSVLFSFKDDGNFLCLILLSEDRADRISLKYHPVSEDLRQFQHLLCCPSPTLDSLQVLLQEKE